MQQFAFAGLVQGADRCVKCGLCLPECPTYRIAQDENESPRGRIALIEALGRGQLGGDNQLVSHLDHCLLCRRCERICPSGVRYGELMDEARAFLGSSRRRNWHHWVVNPAALRTGSSVARLFPTALSKPLGTLHTMHRIARALPKAKAAPDAGEYPSAGKSARGRVGLFPGCATAAQQGGALHAAIRLLGHAGFSTVIPKNAACCGALARHSGDGDGAAALETANRSAFDRPLDAIVSIASGCGIHLDSYTPSLPARHCDINRFLLETGGLSPGDFAPLSARVLLHTPCSMENVYRGGHWARSLLALIPEITIIDAGEPGQCCGSAGDYMLRHPRTAERLRSTVVERATGGEAKILVTSNIGCAMHLADGLRARRAVIEILHPVELLARQLRR